MKTLNFFSKNTYRSLVKAKIFGILLFLSLSFTIYYVLFQEYKIVAKNKIDQMHKTLASVHQSIDQSLKNNYTTALTLALTINDKGVPENFDKISAQLLASNDNIDAVQLVPKGIIRYTYPLKGNEASIGLDILNSKEHRFEALQSIKTRKMYFAGPLQLRQGGLGIVGRLPIYKNNEFWGFSAVIIRFKKETLETYGVNKIDTTKYYFQFSKINPVSQKEEFFFPIQKKYASNSFVTNTIPDGNWKLYLTDKKPNEHYLPLIILAILGTALSLLLGFFTTLFFKKPITLQDTIDKQNEELEKNELKFKSVFDQVALGITYVDCATGLFLEVNKKFCEIMGYSPEESKLMNFKSITHPDDIEDSMHMLERLYKGEIREYSLEKRYIKKSGASIWVAITVSPLWKINETPSNFAVIIKDISERKKNQKIIIDSQKRIESLINTVDGIVWECDAQTFEFSFISKKVEYILGYTPEEWINTPNFWADHIYEKDKDFTLSYCAEQTSLKQNHDFEYRMIAKDGRIVWLRDIVNIIFKKGEAKRLRGIMIDVTKTKEIEKELNNSFDLVSEQNKRLLNFSYIISHNLRSHTSNISSIVDLIDSSESEEEKKEMVQLLKSVSDSLNETMLNLNEIVNIQTNVGVVTETLNLKEHLDHTLTILSDQIELKGVKIISTVNETVEVNYNRSYLESILYNLISNAVRFSHQDRNPTIHIDCYLENKKTVIQVSDNGIGIDLDQNGHKIFGMYKNFSSHKESKGIGLFITKNQVDAMGGKITVESKPNLGTTFKVYL